MKRVVFIVVLFLTLGFYSASSYASIQQIAITPTEEHITLSAGSSYSGSFNVVNQGSSNFTYNVFTAPYYVKGINYTPEFTLLPGAPVVTKWLTLSSGGGILQAGQSSRVNFKLQIPSSTPAGGYYLAVFAETKNQISKQGLAINSRVGILFYINIPGNVINKGNLLSWKSALLQYPPLTSFISIRDSGDLNFETQINYKISDLFGGTKYSLIGQKNMLPKTIRLITLPWDKTPSLGIFKLSGSVTILNHTTKLQSKYVIVISRGLRIILLVSLGILMLLLVVHNLLRRRKKQKSEKS